MADIAYMARALIEQIEGAGFKDELGHRLEMNRCYIRLKDAVDLSKPEVGHRYTEADLASD